MTKSTPLRQRITAQALTSWPWVPLWGLATYAFAVLIFGLFLLAGSPVADITFSRWYERPYGYLEVVFLAPVFETLLLVLVIYLLSRIFKRDAPIIGITGALFALGHFQIFPFQALGLLPMFLLQAWIYLAVRRRSTFLNAFASSAAPHAVHSLTVVGTLFVLTQLDSST